MDWTNYQTSTFNTDITSVAYTENVGNAEIDGMEINAIYALNDSTKVNFYLNKILHLLLLEVNLIHLIH